MNQTITAAPDLDAAPAPATITAPERRPSPPLNTEQRAAIAAITEWLLSPTSSRFYVLQGGAGTGKTFTIKDLLREFRGRIVFTAPTNKATKVLRSSVTTPDYKPECRTIYSLLGLKLEANGELKELKAPEDPIDLSQFKLVVVDEGSMINKQVMGHINTAAFTFGVKFLFMGDPAQLPPVGEIRSPIWDFPDSCALTTVMRHDNQILTLATAIRKVVDHPAPAVKLQSDFDDAGGVVKLSPLEFRAKIITAAGQGLFTKGAAKVIAWRNMTVDTYNSMIRKAIFGQDSGEKWLPGDRLIFTEPAKDFNDDIIATTDDEGTVERVLTEYHPIHGSIKCHRISVQIDGGPLVVAYAVHPEGFAMYTHEVEALAAAAKADRRKWRAFWGFKESFHAVRHGYAITAHRSQGSTYTTVFVDYQDILVNRNRQEAFRCLYVACTRPTTHLNLG